MSTTEGSAQKDKDLDPPTAPSPTAFKPKAILKPRNASGASSTSSTAAGTQSRKDSETADVKVEETGAERGETKTADGDSGEDDWETAEPIALPPPKPAPPVVPTTSSNPQVIEILGTGNTIKAEVIQPVRIMKRNPKKIILVNPSPTPAPAAATTDAITKSLDNLKVNDTSSSASESTSKLENSRGATAGSSSSSDSPNPKATATPPPTSTKTLAEREAEYRAARMRIFGKEEADDTDDLSSMPISTAPSNSSSSKDTASTPSYASNNEFTRRSTTPPDPDFRRNYNVPSMSAASAYGMMGGPGAYGGTIAMGPNGVSRMPMGPPGAQGMNPMMVAPVPSIMMGGANGAAGMIPMGRGTGGNMWTYGAVSGSNPAPGPYNQVMSNMAVGVAASTYSTNGAPTRITPQPGMGGIYGAYQTPVQASQPLPYNAMYPALSSTPSTYSNNNTYSNTYNNKTYANNNNSGGRNMGGRPAYGQQQPYSRHNSNPTYANSAPQAPGSAATGWGNPGNYPPEAWAAIQAGIANRERGSGASTPPDGASGQRPSNVRK
ncbi:hypothetical protein HDV05_004285 [Chytridiales sp. JEL 0842]|nr:hypothetical protein HDV05_004285 [Chytridiales sp. JEL 0842]